MSSNNLPELLEEEEKVGRVRNLAVWKTVGGTDVAREVDMEAGLEGRPKSTEF